MFVSKVNRVFAASIIAGLVLFAPAGAQSSSVASLLAADNGWAKVYAAKQLPQSVGYVDAAGSVLAPNAPKATGRAAIGKLFAEFFALPNVQISWKPTEASVAASGDIGYTSGVYQMSFTQNGKVVPDHGKYVTIWKHEADGSWKVLLDIFNSDLPASPT
jgi:ketosteroid isomerase-like protein